MRFSSMSISPLAHYNPPDRQTFKRKRVRDHFGQIWQRAWTQRNQLFFDWLGRPLWRMGGSEEGGIEFLESRRVATARFLTRRSFFDGQGEFFRPIKKAKAP
jgi:hypothetical protein